MVNTRTCWEYSYSRYWECCWLQHKIYVSCPVGLSCSKDVCMSSSSGTAGVAERKDCACQCLPHLPVFREDLHICIDDIQGKIDNLSLYESAVVPRARLYIYHHFAQGVRYSLYWIGCTLDGLGFCSRQGPSVGLKTSCIVGITGKATRD